MTATRVVVIDYVGARSAWESLEAPFVGLFFATLTLSHLCNVHGQHRRSAIEAADMETTLIEREAGALRHLALLDERRSAAKADCDAARAAYDAAQAAIKHLDKEREELQPELFQLLLERLATLPTAILVIVLRPLPGIEVARLARVHTAFRVGQLCLRQQHPGPEYTTPPANEWDVIRTLARLPRAAFYGYVAVIRSMVAARVDEHGAPLLQATAAQGWRILDEALHFSTYRGHLLALKLLLDAGADVQLDHPLRDGLDLLSPACQGGHTHVVALYRAWSRRA